MLCNLCSYAAMERIDGDKDLLCCWKLTMNCLTEIAVITGSTLFRVWIEPFIPWLDTCLCSLCTCWYDSSLLFYSFEIQTTSALSRHLVACVDTFRASNKLSFMFDVFDYPVQLKCLYANFVLFFRFVVLLKIALITKLRRLRSCTDMFFFVFIDSS